MSMLSIKYEYCEHKLPNHIRLLIQKHNTQKHKPLKFGYQCSYISGDNNCLRAILIGPAATKFCTIVVAANAKS